MTPLDLTSCDAVRAGSLSSLIYAWAIHMATAYSDPTPHLQELLRFLQQPCFIYTRAKSTPFAVCTKATPIEIHVRVPYQGDQLRTISATLFPPDMPSNIVYGPSDSKATVEVAWLREKEDGLTPVSVVWVPTYQNLYVDRSALSQPLRLPVALQTQINLPNALAPLPVVLADYYAIRELSQQVDLAALRELFLVGFPAATNDPVAWILARQPAASTLKVATELVLKPRPLPRPKYQLSITFTLPAPNAEEFFLQFTTEQWAPFTSSEITAFFNEKLPQFLHGYARLLHILQAVACDGISLSRKAAGLNGGPWVLTSVRGDIPLCKLSWSSHGGHIEVSYPATSPSNLKRTSYSPTEFSLLYRRLQQLVQEETQRGHRLQLSC